MGKRIPLTKGIGGEEIGTAMVISTGDPVREFGAFARIDGVLVGLSITDPEMRRVIQGDIGSMSIAPRSAHELAKEFEDDLCKQRSDGQDLARGMQDDIDEGT